MTASWMSKARDHPLAAYMAAHVPFSLSTDDEGVSRIDLTHEYARAVEEQDLSYVDLKHSARDSLEHSFLPGASLWVWTDNYDHMQSACDAKINADSKPSDACRHSSMRMRRLRSSGSWNADSRYSRRIFTDAARRAASGLVLTRGCRMSSRMSGASAVRSSTGVTFTTLVVHPDYLEVIGIFDDELHLRAVGSLCIVDRGT